MQYGVFPGGGTPKRPRKSSGRVVAGHFYNQVRRPSRLRGRLLFTVFGLTGILCLIYGRKHTVDLSRTASSLKDYIPDSITDVLGQCGDFEEQRWDDGVDPENTTHRIVKKPKFHLLVPANKPTENLCKTLLSAAILNYPPPTLIGYGSKGKDERTGADVIRNIFTFLHGKEAHDDDLVVIVEEDAWFQLPAEITLNRFFHGLKESSSKLLDKYGAVKRDNITATSSNQHQTYTMKVLFGSAKECSNGASDPACYSIPESPVPKDIYGDETDKHPEGKYNRPRYMSSSTVMGRVADLRPIYKEATEMLEFNEVGKHGSQYVLSQILGVQEYARTLSLASAANGPSRWRSWLSTVLSKPQDPLTSPPNITLQADKNYEFGIGLDYFSSIFQVMNNSVEDVRFVRFNHPSVITSPSRISAKAFKNPIRLPPDLALTPPPFYQNQISSQNPKLPITELDNMHDDMALWTDVELLTNVIVPGSSVPASLNFDGSEYLLNGEMWEKMWFHPNARALMRQYIRRPEGPIVVPSAGDGGDTWWDLRGGKGGVWTDRGEWLEWNEVCGAFDDKVFGDEKGEFMREKEEVGGEKVVYKFGKVIQGKLPKTKPGNLNAHKGLLGEAMKTGGEAKADHGTQDGESPEDPQNPHDSHATILGEGAKVGIGNWFQVEDSMLKQESPVTPNSLAGEVVKVGAGVTVVDGSQTGEKLQNDHNTAVEELKAKQDNSKDRPVPFGHSINEKTAQDIQAGRVMNTEQGIIGGLSMNIEQGPPMSLGGNMQVSGTLDLESIKQKQAKLFELGKDENEHKTTTQGEEYATTDNKSEDEKKAEEIVKATDESQNGAGQEQEQYGNDYVSFRKLGKHERLDDVVE